MTAQSRRSTFVDIAAVPQADEKADNYFKEVRQAGKVVGIYGITIAFWEALVDGTYILLHFHFGDAVEMTVQGLYLLLEG